MWFGGDGCIGCAGNDTQTWVSMFVYHIANIGHVV